jgi:hypothetical protein
MDFSLISNIVAASGYNARVAHLSTIVACTNLLGHSVNIDCYSQHIYLYSTWMVLA